MRNIFIVSFVLLLFSCNDFLDYKDGDQVIPGKLEHYDELVYGEIIKPNVSTGALPFVELMTDDVDDYVPEIIDEYDSDKRQDGYPYYTWAKNNQMNFDYVEQNDETWATFYHKILMCNIVEKEVGELGEDYEGSRVRLLGEVRFLRAMSYFFLVNFYGEPYQSAEQARTALGVPINKETGLYNKHYQRATLQACYDLMEDDLKRAIVALDSVEGGQIVFRPTADVARLFLSRVYLYQKRYDDVVMVCNELLTNTKASIETLGNLRKYRDQSDYHVNHLYNIDNKGILFSWGKETFTSPLAYWSDGRWIVADDLLRLYQKEDIRLSAFFKKSYGNDPVSPLKMPNMSPQVYEKNYRLEEVYFNRAEAYLGKGGMDHVRLAMSDLNYVRKDRVDGDYELNPVNEKEAWDYFQKEKRREFCFEELRWFDIRRWQVEIIHHYHDFVSSGLYKEYKLRAGSPNYVLNIPLELQRMDDAVKQMEREETLINE